MVAKWNLGVLYRDGDGVSKDMAKGTRCPKHLKHLKQGAVTLYGASVPPVGGCSRARAPAGSV